MATAPTVIDVWMQHPTPRLLAEPCFDSLRRWTGSLTESDIPLDLTLAAMDAGGIRKGCISAWYGPRGPLISNDEVAAIVAAHPERFVGIASGDLYRPMEAVRELRRAVRERGFKGLRFIPWLWDLPPDDRRYYPLYAECIELDVPFCTQVGHTGPLCPSEPGRPIPYLEHVALEFPELRIVAGHIGFPWVGEIISLVTKFPNVYVDTSAYKASRYPPDFVAFMRGHGRKKVMFGTNYPMITPGDCLADLDALDLDDETKRLFLAETAIEVFKLD